MLRYAECSVLITKPLDVAQEQQRVSSETDSQIQQLDAFFTSLLSKDDEGNVATLAFIKKSIRQYNTSANLSDILTEAYLRCHNYIERGHTITNFRGFIRSTSLNLIREYSRIESRESSLSGITIDNLVVDEREPYKLDDIDLNVRVKNVQSALSELTLEEQEILKMRYFEQLSWRDISQKFQEKYNSQINETTLRKRASRALMKLRFLYNREVVNTTSTDILTED
ncbi:hypothetical protein C7B61_00175 [filamentous cyanobacterium CCP1]|nr:hypothetical protein C7B61_00175 [filamentous cyanobacterium CCP1]